MRFKKNDEKINLMFGKYTEIGAIADSLLDRIDTVDEYDDEMDAVICAMNDYLIYYDDQWQVLQYYCTPQMADWEKATDAFINELCECLDEI